MLMDSHVDELLVPEGVGVAIMSSSFEFLLHNQTFEPLDCNRNYIFTDT